MPTQPPQRDPAQISGTADGIRATAVGRGLLRAAEMITEARRLGTDDRPGKGLRPGTRLAFGCPEAAHNTDVCGGRSHWYPMADTGHPARLFRRRLPAGFQRKNLTISGSGMNGPPCAARGSNGLRHPGEMPDSHRDRPYPRFGWLVLRDLTLDGNSHHMGIKGNGAFDDQTGAIRSGCPQFPVFEATPDS